MQHYDEKNETNLYVVWQVIAERKKLVAIIFFVIVLGTTAISFMLPKVYSLEALLMVDFGEDLLGINREKEKARDEKRTIIGNDIIVLLKNTDSKAVFPNSHKYVRKLKLSEVSNERDRVRVTVDLLDPAQSGLVLADMLKFINNQEDIKHYKADCNLRVAAELTAAERNIKEMGKWLQEWERTLARGKSTIANFNPIQTKLMIEDFSLRKQLLKNFLENNNQVKIVVASVSDKPVSPRIALNIVIATMFGLALSVCAAFVLNFMAQVKRNGANN